MKQHAYFWLIATFLIYFSSIQVVCAEENFILIDGASGETVVRMGPHIDERITPCSTFKIALCLMGFDSDVLHDASSPVWEYQEGFDDYLEVWKSPQTPQSWLKLSCLWFSKVLTEKLGMEQFQKYLYLFDYGNSDGSGGLTESWVNSSIQISPSEQVQFLRRMLQHTIPVSDYAIEMTKQLLFLEELGNGWKLFGKTGYSGTVLDEERRERQIGWFIGWIEKDDTTLPFAYQVREKQVNLSQRVPRTKELIKRCDVLHLPKINITQGFE